MFLVIHLINTHLKLKIYVIQTLEKLKIKKDKSVLKAIGINEIKEHLSQKTHLDEIKEKISIKTRQYAKRQSTWARGHMSNWIKLKPSEINKFLKKI